MINYVFARKFLIDLAAFEQTASPRDRENLDQTLAAIITNPELPGRIPSFYDPSSPSYLYRSKKLLISFPRDRWSIRVHQSLLATRLKSTTTGSK